MKADIVARVTAVLSAASGALIAIFTASMMLSSVSSPTFPGDPDDADDTATLIRHLEDTVPALQKRYGVPGVAVLLVQGGLTGWSGTFGELTDTHLLMTHSISKSVTARGIMQLVQDGAIGLDAPVQEYLGAAPYGEVTMRQLLSNASGLPLGPIGVHYQPDHPVPDTAVYLAALADDAVVPSHAPGHRFEYSNTGFAVLELVVREVTGLPFADYMRESVLCPLGMNESTFSWRPDLAGRVPFGYDLQGAPVPPYLYPNKAPGGLFATLHDLGTFLAGSMNDPIEELYKPEVPITGIYRAVADAYGLGHFLETLPGGERAVFHGGQGLGWMTHFHALPDRGEGIVIVTNSQRSWPLIAAVLRDWSVWTGAGEVGMSRILTATRILGVVVGLLAVTGAVLGVRIVRRVFGTTREASRAVIVPAAELVGAGAIILLLLWALRQDYFFMSSVFPTLTRPLGLAMTALAVGLVLDAIFPTVTRQRYKTQLPTTE